MSIRDEVNALCADGRLHRLASGVPGAQELRAICVSTEINTQLVGPWEDTASAAAWGGVRADLAAFIDGDVMVLPREGRHANRANMLRLRPAADEIWETRHRDPRPGIRLFGRFAERNLLIALSWGERRALGAANSRAWRDARVQCATNWRNLFPAYQPLTGAYPDAYLSHTYVL